MAEVTDVACTVPKGLLEEWLAEGDWPGDPHGDMESHFWVPTLPKIETGERVYIVAHGKLRGFAPLIRTELSCVLRRGRSCLVRNGNAVPVTIPEEIRGFQGWRYRFWSRDDEIPFPDWKTP